MTFEKSVTSETLEAELTDKQARETNTQTAIHSALPSTSLWVSLSTGLHCNIVLYMLWLSEVTDNQRLIDWLKVLRPTPHKIGHF